MDDTSKYRNLFFEETDEYLQVLNDCVLNIEKDPEDTQSMEEMFRAAHTLKGMAATMGYTTMAELTHHMENVFELFKKGASSVDEDVISLIFTCLDNLSEIVEDLRADRKVDYHLDDLFKQLDAVAKGEGIESSEAPEAKAEASITINELSDTDAMIIRSAKDKGFKAYHVLVRIAKDSLLKGARAYLVVNRLEQEGEIIQCDPPAEELEEGAFDDIFKLVYLTKKESAHIQDVIENISEIEEVFIEEITDDEVAITVAVQNEVEIEEPKEIKPEIKKIKPLDVKTKEEKPVASAPVSQTIRVDLSRLDSFMNLVSELVIYRTRLEDLSSSYKTTEINEPLEQVARITSELQDLVLKIRMQPVSVVFSRFPRMIRDLSKELNKEMELIIEGEDTELDRTVVSELSEPLIHLLRNAADHGIEPTEERIAKGKPEVGQIKLTAHQEGNKVVITIGDDGKGLNPDVLRESARRKGINVDGLSDKEVIRVIFDQGFSTAKEVTNVSGRGVGMDVVRKKISSLGGEIEVFSEVDQGTSFVIKLPLTLSIIQSLLVKIGSETFALPLGVIDKVVRVEEEEIKKSHNGEVYIYMGKAIPVVRLNEKLNLESTSEKNHLILIALGDQHYGLVVDDLIGQQEIVIKKLNGVLGNMKEYLGATILGNGDITLILDVGNLCGERGD